MISRWITKIQTLYFIRHVIDETDYDIDDQFHFLYSFKEPDSDFDRTFMQHSCQMKRMNFILELTLGIISMIVLPFFTMFLIMKGMLNGKTKKTISSDTIVFLSCSNGKSIYPDDLLTTFDKVVETDFFEGKFLLKKDLRFILKFFKKYPLSFWIGLRLLYRVAVYRFIINKYNPAAIVITGEVSPTASSLTFYCKINNIEHINLLSGERFFEISSSFIHFHKFYIWDDHYKQLFLKLRADKNTKFIVHQPLALTIDISVNKVYNKLVDYTYYLSVFTEDEIKKISEMVDVIANSGYKIRLRPHPKWTNMTLLRKYIQDIYIEDLRELSIENSIASTNAVISVSSTVLLQSFLVGRDIIVDDVIFKSKYENLKKLDYIIYKKPHKKLSDILAEMQSK